MDWSLVLIEGVRDAVGVPAAAFALAAIGLNLHYGFTGLLNFGPVGFALVGGYGIAVTVHHGGPFWLGVVVGAVAAAVLALILGVPTLRLRADYLAIVTIAAAEILRLVVRSPTAEPLTRGVFGITRFAGAFYDLNPIPPGSYGLGRLVFSDRRLWVMVVGWALAAVSVMLVWRLVHSPWGRVLRAIREDEDAVRALGKDVFVYKLQSLIIGGVIIALAGMVTVVDAQAVNPDDFTANVTIFMFTIMIVGGAGSVVGPVAGSVAFWFLFSGLGSFLRQGIEAGWPVLRLFETTEVGAVRLAVLGITLGALIVFRPQGIFGSREEQRLEDT